MFIESKTYIDFARLRVSCKSLRLLSTVLVSQKALVLGWLGATIGCQGGCTLGWKGVESMTTKKKSSKSVMNHKQALLKFWNYATWLIR